MQTLQQAGRILYHELVNHTVTPKDAPLHASMQQLPATLIMQRAASHSANYLIRTLPINLSLSL